MTTPYNDVSLYIVTTYGAEISLRMFQFCNLVTVNGGNIENQEDFNERVRVASFIATLQASYTDFHYLRPIWRETTEKEALIGVSITGVASGHAMDLDFAEAAKIVVKENKRVAKILGINYSARSTTIKPEGTSSLVLNTSSGVHAWHNDFYVRRVRVGKNEAIYNYLRRSVPSVLEDEYFRPDSMAVISIPKKAPEGSITRQESALNLLERVKYLNKNWVKNGHNTGENRNNVSCTISIKDDEWSDVGDWMWKNRNDFTAISVLPYDGGTYIQAPYEDITEEEFNKLSSSIRSINLENVTEDIDNTDLQGELACAGGACEIK